MRVLRFLLYLACLAAPVLRADLDRVRAEPNREKRSKLALENAEYALKAARKAYGEGDTAAVSQRIAEVRESVELAAASLKETGKNPRKSPKYFKNAEIGTRNLLKRLDGFREEMSVADRPMLQETISKIQQIHDDLLVGVMEGKRK